MERSTQILKDKIIFKETKEYSMEKRDIEKRIAQIRDEKEQIIYKNNQLMERFNELKEEETTLNELIVTVEEKAPVIIGEETDV